MMYGAEEEGLATTVCDAKVESVCTKDGWKLRIRRGGKNNAFLLGLEPAQRVLGTQHATGCLDEASCGRGCLMLS